MKKNIVLLLAFAVTLMTCDTPSSSTTTATNTIKKSLSDKYVKVRLTTDMPLTANQKKMIPLLVEAAQEMDKCFQYEAYNGEPKFEAKDLDSDVAKFVGINYGPWDRLNGNKPFVPEVGEKPLGASFYPADMTKEEFEKADLKDKDGLYNFIERDKDSGKLVTVPYHKKFEKEHKRAAALLLEAAELAEDKGLKRYLTLRSYSLLNDDYQASDMAWLDMKDNAIDVVIGPIETYEDQLFGYKAAHEAYILVKDKEWSDRLAKYAQFLPELQRGIPVPDKYKQEKPGRDTELNAYDVVYYAGDCNAGSKTIAINLPNDEEVQLKKGTRRLQLKNAMRAKFDKILLPIADVLIDESQRKHITFDAFFGNTMFHEVAHGLGIKNTIDGKGTVRKALKEHASAIEEGKADVLGLYMINQLNKKGEIEGDIKDYYVTFMAGIFRSVRFGASSAHGKANMIRFNYFKEKGAFERDADTGKYRINIDKFQEATDDLSELILTLQGDGNYDATAKLVAEKGKIGAQLQSELDRLSDEGIPVDVVFEQGLDVLGL